MMFFLHDFCYKFDFENHLAKCCINLFANTITRQFLITPVGSAMPPNQWLMNVPIHENCALEICSRK